MVKWVPIVLPYWAMVKLVMTFAVLGNGEIGNDWWINDKERAIVNYINWHWREKGRVNATKLITARRDIECICWIAVYFEKAAWDLREFNFLRVLIDLPPPPVNNNNKINNKLAPAKAGNEGINEWKNVLSLWVDSQLPNIIALYLIPSILFFSFYLSHVERENFFFRFCLVLLLICSSLIKVF